MSFFSLSFPSMRQSGLVLDQNAGFGALTLASSGGFKPIDTSNNEVALTSYDSLVSGSLGSYTPSISGGRLVFDLAGAPDGAVLHCSHAGGTVDLTISSEADTYSVASQADWNAVLDLTTATISGKTIKARPGTSITSRIASTFDFRNRQFASPLTVSSHDTNSKGTWDQFQFRRCSNVVLDGVNITNQDSNHFVMLIEEVSTGCADITVQNCTMAGIFKDPNGDYSEAGSYGTNSTGVSTNGGNHSNITIYDNLIEDVDKAFNVSATGTIDIQGNEVHRFYRDVCQITWPGASVAVTMSYNVASQPIGRSDDADNPHVDFLQFIGSATAAANWASITVEGNRFWQGDARGTAQFIFMDDMNGSGFYYDNPRIVGNATDITSTHGVTVQQAKDCSQILGNQTPNAPVKIGQGTTTGTHVVKRCIASSYLIAGTPTTESNVEIGVDGTIAQTFDGDGGSFDAASLAEFMTMWSIKANGPADIDASGGASVGDAGAIGSGYVTWPSTVPGRDGSIDTDYDL
ncbi:MAG: hypothetical protein Q8R92_18805 [Deltaproteobacteria bacterium]|nr:hypothetical protein [Deltaproteobacteria bacterium]